MVGVTRLRHWKLATSFFFATVALFAGPVSVHGAELRFGHTSVTIISNGCVASSWNSGTMPQTFLDNAIARHISNEINPSQISTRLMQAVVRNDLDTVVELIDQGVDINEKSPEMGCTALIWAAAFKRMKIAARLLNAGADIHLADAAGRTPLMIAAGAMSIELVKIFISRGADVNRGQTGGVNEIGQTALIHAARRPNNSDVLEHLIKSGAALNTADEHGKTALIAATWFGHASNVSVLLSAGADRSPRNSFD